MASSSSLLNEEQLLCPICLCVFVEPVSTPCGHNYCRSCLTSYWDSSPLCLCPVCKESFSLRPQLRVNTFICGLVQQFTSLQLTETHTAVLCDMCAQPQHNAIRSCVECMSSYCEAHLEPHYRLSGLRRHTLVEPVSDLEHKVCPHHQQLLSFYCPNQGLLVCKACTASPSHQGALPLEQACRQLRAELGGSEDRVNAMIQEKLKTVSSIRQTITGRQEQTKQVITLSEQGLNEVVSKVQKNHKDLVLKMEVKQQEADSKAEAVIGQIEQELKDLVETQGKLGDLKQTKDPFVFLQTYPNRPLLLHTPSVSLKDEEEVKKMRQTLSSRTSQLQIFLNKLNGKMISEDTGTALKRAQRHAVSFVLDPETANPELVLSHDLKQVRYNKQTKQNKNLNPKKFVSELAVLSDRGFSSGQFYFEVIVGQKDEWLLGVIFESVPRGEVILNRPDSKIWALHFRINKFYNHNCRDDPVYWGKVERVGVYVDYDKGVVSFYDVKTATCIYSFHNCVFTERLFPILNPCDHEFPLNTGPMMIVPVNHE